MQNSKQSWSVFVPCFNESKTIRDVVNGVDDVLKKIASKYEVVVVDDGSTDDSRIRIKALVETNNNVSAVYHDANYGIGSVQRLAYTTARYENVIIISGDGQFNPDELLKNPTLESNTWLSFYRQKLPAYSISRKFLSSANKMMNRLLFGLNLRDVNWAMAFRTADLKKLNLMMSSTLLKSEACIKMNMLGYKVKEVPSVYHPRKFDKAKGASFKIIMQALSEIGKLYKEIQRFRTEQHPVAKPS